MAQALQLKIKGLFTSFNELSEVPEGALLAATNIDILKDSIAEPRRGFSRLTGGYSDNTHRTAKTWFYQEKQFGHHGTYGSENTISYLNSGTWTSVGTFSAPTGAKIRTVEQNQNLLLTTSTGVYKLDAYNATPVLAGAYKGLDLSASASASASTWLSNNYRVAYRVVWGYKDTNKNLVLGAPSQRESYKNTSGSAKAVDLSVTIPSGVTTSWFVQVYRSTAVDNSATEIEPSDELGLVYEANPTSGEISAGLMTITDIVPDALRGATIYTAPSQEGIAYANERPPLCKDITEWRGCVWYGNTTSKHRFIITLLSADGSNGLADDDTITIGGITYTAKATETIASAQFQRYTAGSASQDIRDTALSLVRVINRHSSSTVYAYYLSGPDDLPGKILLEERSIGGAAFDIISDAPATAFSPQIDSTETSSNDRYKNGVFFGKPNQSDGAPLVNFFEVGNRDRELLRMVPLRDALYFFKEDEGIYKATGYYPNFTVELMDSSAKLIGAETPAILNNQIYCLTDQGATIVSDGTKVISRPIEQDILSLFGSGTDEVADLAFGVAYESDRKYYLFLPSSSADTYPTQAYVFNSFTNSWVRHELSKTCGVVYNNDLYLGDAESNYINKENKTYTYRDYVDYGFPSSIDAISSRTLTIGSGADNIAVGDIIYQSDTVFAVVQEVDSVASTVEIETDPGFSVASCDVLKAIETDIKWAPITMGNPGIQKHNHTATLLFKEDFAGTGELGFVTDLSQFEATVEISGPGLGVFGLFPWGERPWGGVPLKRPARQWIPREKQRSSQLTVSFRHRYGYSKWLLQGLTVFGTPGSDRLAV